MNLLPNVILKRKAVAINVIVLLAIMIYASTTLAQGGDSQPPQVNFSTISVSPQTVSVGETVTVAATVTDNMSGVRNVGFRYMSPSGSRFMHIDQYYEEGLLRVTFSETRMITALDEAGVWILSNISVEDYAGNYLSYQRSDISNPSQYDFVVNNPTGGDSQPPQVNFSTISVSPQTVSVGETVTFAATVTDNISGVYTVQVGYRSPNKNRFEWLFVQFYDEEGLLSVNFSETRTINVFDEDGVWTIDSILVEDHAGNYQWHNRDDISNPSQYNIIVNNPTGGDSQPPQVNFNSISVTPQLVKAGETVTVSATVTDNLSGVRTAQFFYRPPSRNRYVILTQFYDEEGLLSVNFSANRTINAFDEDGVWTLDDIFVKDHAGNSQWICRCEISNPSQCDFVVLNTFAPEEKDVIPENGEATVAFPNSGVTITIQTDEAGTITVTRYPADFRAPPEGQLPASIYLNIEPSASLQGKPATFTVGYSLPLPEGVDESTLKLYRWSGSAWTVIPDQVLDTEAKTITASVTGFSTFGVFGSGADDNGDDDENGSARRREIVTRFSRIFNYTGDIDHEHQYRLVNGVAGLVSAGKGELGGTHDGMTREAYRRNSFNSNAFYQITTAPDALPGDYMRMVSAYSKGNESAARTGIETNPGGTGSIKENVASSSDSGGSYNDYSVNVDTDDGRLIIESAVDSASVSANVEGSGFVYFSITTDSGGQKTGWWDLP